MTEYTTRELRQQGLTRSKVHFGNNPQGRINRYHASFFAGIGKKYYLNQRGRWVRTNNPGAFEFFSTKEERLQALNTAFS